MRGAHATPQPNPARGASRARNATTTDYDDLGLRPRRCAVTGARARGSADRIGRNTRRPLTVATRAVLLDGGTAVGDTADHGYTSRQR